MTSTSSPASKRREELLHSLPFQGHESLFARVETAYPSLGDAGKAALLGVLGAWGTREAARTWVRVTGAYGAAPRAWNNFTFGAITTLLEHADVMLPHLWRVGHERIDRVAECVRDAMLRGTLHVEQARTTEPAVAAFVEETLQACFGELRRPWNRILRRLMPSEVDHLVAGAVLGLDLSALVNADVGAMCRSIGARHEDALIRASSTLASLAHGEPADARHVSRLARRHRNRGAIFRRLASIDRLDLFPRRWRTWPHFAMANLVVWLCHPSELGRPPSHIRVAARFEVDPDDQGSGVMYVLKFRTWPGPWYAGVSGPHVEVGEPCPTYGASTFSRFDRWSAASADAHLRACVSVFDAGS